jgi:hypothetical protein
MIVGSGPDRDAAGAVGAFDLDSAVISPADRVMPRGRRWLQRDVENSLGGGLGQRSHQMSVQRKLRSRMQKLKLLDNRMQLID